ncbi:MAG: hypothetical protein KAK00_07610 [Nanoarchaeota archaeon]|nr:hypothetical protein [Nanoarchaeota archaeon]
MPLNIYAFDDCSILHQANIEIPEAFKRFFDYDCLHYDNYKKLRNLSENLKKKNVKKHRFIPSNIETSIIKVGNELLSKCGYVQMLGTTFKSKVLIQLKDFVDSTIDGYEEIEKNDNINDAKRIFLVNERELKKGTNIPEDDDFKIIAGYQKYEYGGKKYFITEDEHFWGYSDLILDNFEIHIIEEWRCHLIKI